MILTTTTHFALSVKQLNAKDVVYLDCLVHLELLADLEYPDVQEHPAHQGFQDDLQRSVKK